MANGENCVCVCAKKPNDGVLPKKLANGQSTDQTEVLSNKLVARVCSPIGDQNTTAQTKQVAQIRRN